MRLAMTSNRHKMVSGYCYLPFVWTMFSSNAADLADIPQAPAGIPLGWPANAVVRGYKCRLGTVWVRKTIF